MSLVMADDDEICTGALEFTLDATFAAEIVRVWNVNSPPSRITNADLRMLRAAGIVWLRYETKNEGYTRR